MRQTELPSRELAILSRIVGLDEPALSLAVAEGLLALRFSAADQERMNELAAKARAGTLTGDEQTDIEAYSRVNGLLGILHSRARRALKRGGATGTAKRH